ncbi:hypothetical protein J4444_02430 [Candidatus Woesearchaeota archaeon]|nr:hypothetical protein [Candidatus Woesearchaeota archaeon]
MKKSVIVILAIVLGVILLSILGVFTFCSLLSGASCFSSPTQYRMEPPGYRVYQNDSNAEPFPNCPDTLEPVCGVDNTTFRNACEARWIPIAYEGWCKGAEPKGE